MPVACTQLNVQGLPTYTCMYNMRILFSTDVCVCIHMSASVLNIENYMQKKQSRLLVWRTVAMFKSTADYSDTKEHKRSPTLSSKMYSVLAVTCTNEMLHQKKSIHDQGGQTLS
jgi:hypothetical protein